MNMEDAKGKDYSSWRSIVYVYLEGKNSSVYVIKTVKVPQLVLTVHPSFSKQLVIENMIPKMYVYDQM